MYQGGSAQSGVLRPLHFILFIDDLLHHGIRGLESNMCADDLVIWTTSSSADTTRDTIQKGTNHVTEWAKEWRMKINPEKCEGILFKPATNSVSWNMDIKIDGARMRFEKCIKVLGVLLDQRLSFGDHANKIIKKIDTCNTLLKHLGGIDWGASKNHLKSVYLATGRSHIDYAAPVWGPRLNKANYDKIEKCQRRALRTISGLCRTSPLDSLYNIWEVHKRIDYLIADKLDK